MPSPICTVQDGSGSPQATTNGVNVTAGHVITIALVDPSGVDNWAVNLFGRDGLVTPPTVTVNQTTKIATFTAPAGPFSLVYDSVVNNGKDSRYASVPAYHTRFKICALTTGGNRLLAVNETAENDSAFGWTEVVNTPLRSGTFGSGAVIFDGGPSTSNVRSARVGNQSPIDNTKSGIVNLGSDTSGTSTGASNDYSSVLGGDQGEASGLYSTTAGGLGCVASGDYSFSTGASIASGLASAAVSEGTASGSHAFSAGITIASGAHSAAFGKDVTASGSRSAAFGESTSQGVNGLSSGHASFTAGIGCIASNEASVSIGNLCQSTFPYTVSMGNQCVAGIDSSIAWGTQSLTYMQDQFARSSGMHVTPGDAQRGELEMRCHTAGIGANETVELKHGQGFDQFFTPATGKTFILTLKAVANAKESDGAGGTDRAAWIHEYIVQNTGGTITFARFIGTDLPNTGTTTTNSAVWKLLPSVKSSPARLGFDINTEASTSTLNIHAILTWSETTHPA